jgi:hypothetical protein
VPSRKPPKIDAAVSVYWPIQEHLPSGDGSRLYLCVPREIASQIEPVRFPAPRRPRS